VPQFENLHRYWQIELIKHRFGQKLSAGMPFDAFVEDIRGALPIRPKWLSNETSIGKLPFAGNINHERLIVFATRDLNVSWRPPAASRGGEDLELIRRARNDLAHGDDTFENIGGQYVVDDIAEKLQRIRLFMCSYLRMLERYRAGGRYKIN
jgi:hypothetical protein